MYTRLGHLMIFLWRSSEAKWLRWVTFYATLVQGNKSKAILFCFCGGCWNSFFDEYAMREEVCSETGVEVSCSCIVHWPMCPSFSSMSELGPLYWLYQQFVWLSSCFSLLPFISGRCSLWQLVTTMCNECKGRYDYTSRAHVTGFVDSHWLHLLCLCYVDIVWFQKLKMYYTPWTYVSRVILESCFWSDDMKLRHFTSSTALRVVILESITHKRVISRES